MKKTINEIKNRVTFFNFFLGAIIVGILFLAITTIYNYKYAHDMIKTFDDNQARIETLLNNINSKNNNKNKITIKNVDLQKDDFMKQYYLIQSDWLNKWLTTLAIIMAMMGIIIPICFVKFLENKEKEMNRIIQEAKEQKNKTKANVREMATQLKKVTEKSNQMTAELEEVKIYVCQVKASSMYAEAMNLLQNDKDDEAKELIKKAYTLNEKDDKILEALAMKVYLSEKKYDNALKYIEDAIQIKNEYGYYYDRAVLYYEMHEYDKALADINFAISQSTLNNITAYYTAFRANIFSEKNDKLAAKKDIDMALSMYASRIVMQECSVSAINIGEYSLAIDLIKKVNIHKKSATNYYNLTEAYIFNENFEEALKIIEKYKNLQNKKECYGIYTDDYEKWLNKLNQVEQTETVIKIKEEINQLEKRDREHD